MCVIITAVLKVEAKGCSWYGLVHALPHLYTACMFKARSCRWRPLSQAHVVRRLHD